MASGGVTPKDIYDELRAQGASEIAALGIMANMMNESGLNPEAVNPAGPASGVGLVQWQTTDYPHAASLVTGHPQADMVAQIKYLASTGGFRAAQGTNAGQAAGNFAANYEKCATCQPGGQQYQARVENTLTLAGWAKSGHWPTSVGGGARVGPGAIGTTGSGPGNTPDCAWKIDLNVPLVGGNICLLTKSEIRTVAGVGLMFVGGAVALAGLVVAAAMVGARALGPAGNVAEGVGGAMMIVPGLQGAGAGVAAAGRAAQNPRRAMAARQRRGAAEDAELERRMGQPRLNPNMEVRGGVVRQNAQQRAAQRARERRIAAQRARAIAAGDEPPF